MAKRSTPPRRPKADANTTSAESPWQLNWSAAAARDHKKVLRSPHRQHIDNILKTLQIDPYRTGNNLHPLKYRRDTYSRRVNFQHRITYHIDKAARRVTLLGLFGHPD